MKLYRVTNNRPAPRGADQSAIYPVLTDAGWAGLSPGESGTFYLSEAVATDAGGDEGISVEEL